MKLAKSGWAMVGTFCLCTALVAQADSTFNLPQAKELRQVDVSSLPVINPRGGDGCSVDNGPPDGPQSNGTQLDSSFPFFAQVADDFMLDCVGGAACEGDANGDNVVDPLDSGYVLARFGCSVGTGDPDCDAADQNGDGVVDPLDVGFVLARFGPCPEGGGGGQALITQVVFTSAHYNPECGTPTQWSGVRLVVYNDAGGIPDGEPVDDGTILGTPVADYTVEAADMDWVEVDANEFLVTLPTAMVVDNGVLYWLAISPIKDFTPDGQVGWTTTFQQDGNPAHQFFAAAGLTEWTALSQADTGILLDVSFTLGAEPTDVSDPTGACCSGGVCTESVALSACNGDGDRFYVNGTCGDVDPACDAGACCMSDGSCLSTNEAGCAGDFLGAGTLCSDDACPQPAPANDDCANAIEVFDGDNDYSTRGATTDGPTDGAEGPCGDASVGNADAWYTYTATCDGQLEVSLCKFCDGDTTVQVYDGTSCEALGAQIACDDDGCGIGAGPSVASACTVTTGQEVLIRIGAWNDGSLPEDPQTAGILTITCDSVGQDCCEISACGGCADQTVEDCVCAIDSFCCDTMWDEACVAIAEASCGLVCE